MALFDESKHKRGLGAQGGQFVSNGGPGGKPVHTASIGYNGKSGRGTGYGQAGGDKNVKALQKALNKLGIGDSSGKPLAVDGKFGPKTTAAVRRLQKKLKLPVDGKITPVLLKRIQGLKRHTSLVDPSVKKKTAPAKKVAAPARKAAPAKASPPPSRHLAGSQTRKRS